jgi:hypothetical protein
MTPMKDVADVSLASSAGYVSVHPPTFETRDSSRLEAIREVS